MSLNPQQNYAYNQSNGDVTVPVNSSYVQAYAEYIGITEPVNGSWIQAICVHFGITQPLYGSWLIALANYYGITEPVNGSWWYAIGQAGSPVPTDLIWDLVNTEWQNETTTWKTAPVPTVAFPDVTFTDEAFPTLVGTASPNVNIYLTVAGFNYQTTSDGLGDWSITLVDALQPSLAPGTQYEAFTYAKDPSTGAESSTITTTITMITTVTDVTVTVNLYDTYGDGWNNGWIEVQKEVSPGVWESIEYNENPFRFTNYIPDYTNYMSSGTLTNPKYYKTDGITSTAVSGPYGLRFETYEPGVTNNGVPPTGSAAQWKTCVGLRSLTLTVGNYRVISGAKGFYESERRWEIIKDGNIIANYGPSSSLWVAGDVQATFTI